MRQIEKEDAYLFNRTIPASYLITISSYWFFYAAIVRTSSKVVARHNNSSFSDRARCNFLAVCKPYIRCFTSIMAVREAICHLSLFILLWVSFNLPHLTIPYQSQSK
jgi:succinate-acetate transporter protein